MLHCNIRGKHTKAAVTSLAFRYIKSRIKRLEITRVRRRKAWRIAIQRADTANWRTHPFYL